MLSDNNGNLLTSLVGTNTWDYKNRLIQTVGPGTITYAYDHNDDRVQYSTASTTIYYPNQYYNVSSATTTKQIYANNQPIATLIGTGTSTDLYYILTDQIGGSSIMTSDTRTIVEMIDYYPYGDIRIDRKLFNLDEQKKFTGHEYDEDTQMSYMGARYYNGQIGKFISQDPAFLAVGNESELQQITNLSLDKYLSDPQGLNSYAYARNNPLRMVDDNGEWYREFLTGQQSWDSFYGEMGDASLQLSQGSSVWNSAMNHPYIAGATVGVVSGGVAYGAAAAITQASVGINLGRLSSLPMDSRVDTITRTGFTAIEKATGLTKTQAVQTIQSVGKSVIDMRPNNVGNINTIANVGEKAIRITTNPTASKIISSGVMNASKVPQYISSGAMKAVPTFTSVAKSVTRFISNLFK